MENFRKLVFVFRNILAKTKVFEDLDTTKKRKFSFKT